MSFDDVKSILRGFYKARVLHFVIIASVLFFILFRRIFVLQIINGDTYDTDFSVRTRQTMSVPGVKGNIYDRNGKLLAYNELVYTVEICDSGIYEDKNDKNLRLNKIISDMCDIITGYGDKLSIDMIFDVDVFGNYVFVCDEGTKNRFFRDIFGKKSVSLLTEEEKAYTAADTVKYLCKEFGIDESYSKQEVLYIIYFRNLMKNNSYQRYLKFNVASGVCERTVATILENSEELTGVTISQNYVRKYVDSKYFSHIIGYTGRVSQDELVELQEKDPSYESNDIVGKIGIEKAMELELSGDKGVREVYVDNVGRVTEVISETKAKRGNDIYLSIDADLTKKVYDEIEVQLSRLILSKITLGGEESRYEYNAYGDITDVFIPINDVYFSIIDNNMVNINAFESSEYENQRNIYSKFIKKRSEVIERLKYDLKNGDTALKNLSADYRIYEYYIYQYLLNYGIITRSRLDVNDEVYKQWYDESISLKEFLVHAISSNWVDVLMVTDEEYQSLYEAYDSLLDYVFEKLPYDEGFSKKIYKYLVYDQVITGRELCMTLYEQGVLEYSESDYSRLKGYSYSAYDFMINKISSLEITPAMMALKPCSASVVITHPKTGEIIALVSYPGYDNNMMSGFVNAEYYKKVRNDKSIPLLNRATQSLCAPGSTYKVNTSIAGACEGVLGLDEQLYCGGIYKTVTPSPRCWAYPGGHGWVDMTHALMHSCNCFFYEVGYRLSIDNNGNFSNELGTTRLAKYAKLLGLATKTGIEIDEATPHPSDINSIASAIGQGSNNFTPLNLARYVTTIATRGTCYDFSLISKIVDSSSNVVYTYSPRVNNVCDFVSDDLWNHVHEGMRLVLLGNMYFRDLDFAVAGKTGTAQENLKEPNHALLITFGPYSDPEIAVSCVVQNGYISSNAQMLTGEIYKIYFNKKGEDQPAISGGNTVND